MSNINFFKFKKEGDSIEGVFCGFYESKYGLCVKIITKNNEEFFVGLNNFVLKDIFKSIYNLLIIDKSILDIVYESFSKKTKIFRVFLNGTEIKQPLFEKISDDQKIKLYFDSLLNK